MSLRRVLHLRRLKSRLEPRSSRFSRNGNRVTRDGQLDVERYCSYLETLSYSVRLISYAYLVISKYKMKTSSTINPNSLSLLKLLFFPCYQPRYSIFLTRHLDRFNFSSLFALHQLWEIQFFFPYLDGMCSLV